HIGVVTFIANRAECAGLGGIRARAGDVVLRYAAKEMVICRNVVIEAAVEPIGRVVAGERGIEIVTGGIDIRVAGIGSSGRREKVADDFCGRGIDRDRGRVDGSVCQGIGQGEGYGAAANTGKVTGGPTRGQCLRGDQRGLIQTDTFVIEIEEQFILDDWASGRGAEGVGAEGGVESRDSIRGVPSLTGKIPKTAAMKFVGASACDDRKIGGLGELGAIAGGVYAEFSDAFDRGKEIRVRSAIAHRLDGDAIKRKRSSGGQLSGEGQVAALILIYTWGERSRLNGAGRVGSAEVERERADLRA